MVVDKQALFDLIAAELSLEEIMDILGWDTIELVEAIGDHIMEYEVEFKEAVQ
jgi:hypothetical protein